VATHDANRLCFPRPRSHPIGSQKLLTCTTARTSLTGVACGLHVPRNLKEARHKCACGLELVSGPGPSNLSHIPLTTELSNLPEQEVSERSKAD
jgi:hypothetical protein